MIFYFSGTGNTKWVAEQIARAIGEQLFYIPDLIRENRHVFTLSDQERVGFCFPTHGWQPPRIVRNFIKKLNIGFSYSTTAHGTPYCWALTTCGDDMGEAMTILNKELSKVVVGGASTPLRAETMFSVIMPESYVCLPFMKTDTEEREAMKIDLAKHQIPHIIQIIQTRRRGIVELDKGPTPRLYSYVIGNYFNHKMITDSKFIVDAGKCIHCGKCAKVCPTDNIKGTPPEWLHNGRCTCCLACYHYCPVHAINYGSITRRRNQYYFNRREDQR
ncbi:MAG: EFR1 family ferrodoxin [Prevotella sp.]|nr:EFR1 family ferrodoxin [Prevotella sp.]